MRCARRLKRDCGGELSVHSEPNTTRLPPACTAVVGLKTFRLVYSDV